MPQPSTLLVLLGIIHALLSEYSQIRGYYDKHAQRAQYGQSSEKKTYVLNEDQLNFFNEAENSQDHKAEEPTEETLTVKAHVRKKKRTVDELAKNLPVAEVVIELPESRLVRRLDFSIILRIIYPTN